MMSLRIQSDVEHDKWALEKGKLMNDFSGIGLQIDQKSAKNVSKITFLDKK